MALPQNSLILIVMTFFDCALAHFGAPIEILMDQSKDFFRSFEALCTKSLINYYTSSKNHSKINGLTK